MCFYLEVLLVRVFGLLVAVEADHLRVVVADVAVRLLSKLRMEGCSLGPARFTIQRIENRFKIQIFAIFR